MYKSIVKKPRYISLMGGVLEFYPDDIKKIAENNEYLSNGLANDQFMVIEAKPGPASDQPGGYRVSIYSPSNGVEPDKTIAHLDIGPNDAFVYYNRRKQSVPELHKITPPTLLKDKVAWALGATKKLNEKRSMHDLRAHYDSLLTAYVARERTDDHTPRRFFYKNFEAVVNFNEDGTADRNNSAYYIKGYPTVEEALEVLHAAIRHNGWLFSSVSKINYIISLITPKTEI